MTIAAALEVLAPEGKAEAGRGRDQLRLNYTHQRLAPALDLKLFASEELTLSVSRRLDRDRIRAGARVTANQMSKFRLYYLGDQSSDTNARPRADYAIQQFTSVI